MIKFTQKFNTKGNSGFSMLEVVLSLSFILLLSLSSVSMLRSTIDKRQALAKSAKINHRMSYTMSKVTGDLQHVFHIVPNADLNIARKTTTLFRSDGKSELLVTTMNHRRIQKNSYESDQTFVVYRLADDKEQPGRSHLYRGESKVLPEKFSDEPPLQLLARNVKSFAIQPWSGDRWVEGKWDTERSEWKNKLPKMVKVDMEFWEEDADPSDPRADEYTSRLQTVVYLPRSWGLKEHKNPVSSIKYY